MPARVLSSCSLLLTIAALSACSLLTNERVLFDQGGIRIGLEADPTVPRSGDNELNNHPADLSPKDFEALLQVVQVSGWSGTIVGMLVPPRPVPLFTAKELSTISGPLAAAFHDAKPTERIFFSLPKPEVTYSEDRTVGALFLRGRYLHVVVTDHSAFIQADTGGGDVKDIRDTKGMKLWVVGPAQAATVPDAEMPRWASFETVHISLNTKEVLAQRAKTIPSRLTQQGAGPQTETPSQPIPQTGQAGVSQEDLQLQIRELTSSNLELRGRLEEQNKRMETLTDQLEQLRLELEKAKTKAQLPRKLPPQ